MTTTTHERPTSPASDAYLAAVGAALAGVPDSDRQELLDDLAEHLREMAPANEADLIEQLGTPEQYAAELLASAGIELFATTTFARLKVAERTRRITAMLDSPRGRSARAFWRDLRPGWWVIRAWLILAAVAARSGLQQALWIPSLTHSDVQDIALLLGAVVLSVWIGRGTAAPIDRRRRWASLILTGIGIIATVSVLTADRSYFYQVNTVSSDPSPPGELIGPNGNPVSNVFAYDASGKSVGPVFLFDQDGAPIDVGNASALQENGVPFVSGLFPQPIFATDQYGTTRAVQPKPPAVRVPRLPELPQATPPATATPGAKTPVTTAKRPTIGGAQLPVTTVAP